MLMPMSLSGAAVLGFRGWTPRDNSEALHERQESVFEDREASFWPRASGSGQSVLRGLRVRVQVDLRGLYARATESSRDDAASDFRPSGAS